MKTIKINQKQKKRLFENIETEVHLNGFEWKKVQNIINKGYLVHGSSNEFTEFDTSRIQGGSRGIYGYGMYFSDEAYKAIEYGSEIMYTPKSIYNFFDLDAQANVEFLIPLDDKLKEYYDAKNKLETCRNAREYEYYSEIIDNFYFSSTSEHIYNSFKKFVEENPTTTMENIFKYVKNSYHRDIDKSISYFLLDLGFDGLKCGNQYVIFNFKLLNKNIGKEELD